MLLVVTCLWNHLDVLYGRAFKGGWLFVHATKDSKGILRTCHNQQNVGMRIVMGAVRSGAAPTYIYASHGNRPAGISRSEA